MIKLHLFIILSFLIASCANKPVEESKISLIDHVGVVSVLDDKMTVKYAGPTNFTNKEFAADTSSWNLNKTIVDDIREELGKLNKNSLKITLDAEKIQQGKKEALSLKNIYLGNRYQGIQQYVLDEASKQGARYLFVVHPTLNENFPMHKAGYGLLCQNPVGKKGEQQLYFMIGAELWNVQTKQIESRITITPTNITLKTGKPCDDATKMSAEKMATLYKDQVTELAKKSVQQIMAGTGLIR